VNPAYLTLARTQLEELRQLMAKHSDTAIHPMALLIMPNNSQVIIVMEWRSTEEKEIVLRKLGDAARAADAIAVILFGTATAILAKQLDEPVSFLFAGIHVPGEKTYCLGQIFAMVAGELVFLEELNSSEHDILPFQIPPIWETK